MNNQFASVKIDGLKIVKDGTKGSRAIKLDDGTIKYIKIDERKFKAGSFLRYVQSDCKKIIKDMNEMIKKKPKSRC